MSTVLLSDVLDGPTLSKATAERLGPVRAAILDVAGRRLVAIQVGKGRRARVADWEALSGVGPDATVVEDETRLRPPRGDAEAQAASGKLALLGARVLTERGNAHGTLADLDFEPVSGALVTLRTTEGDVRGDRLRAHGRYAIVIASDPEDDR